jgi:hypothetical protein
LVIPRDAIWFVSRLSISGWISTARTLPRGGNFRRQPPADVTGARADVCHDISWLEFKLLDKPGGCSSCSRSVVPTSPPLVTHYRRNFTAHVKLSNSIRVMD